MDNFVTKSGKYVAEWIRSPAEPSGNSLSEYLPSGSSTGRPGRMAVVAIGVVAGSVLLAAGGYSLHRLIGTWRGRGREERAAVAGNSSGAGEGLETKPAGKWCSLVVVWVLASICPSN